VPGVDDGAPTVEAGLAALTAFSAAGIRRVVTTPHLDGGRVHGTRRQGIIAAFQQLAAAAGTDLPDVRLELAYEVRIDDPEIDLSDRTLGLSDGGGLLVEFPQLAMPAYSDRMLQVVSDQNWRPVLAHPERYAGIGLAYDWIDRWRALGAVMCLNVGSLFGEHGPEAQRVARRMLTSGHADLIASDHHARPRRSTTLRQGWDLLTAGATPDTLEAVRTLMVSNPLAVLSGEALMPVAGIGPAGGWLERVKRRLLGDSG